MSSSRVTGRVYRERSGGPGCTRGERRRKGRAGRRGDGGAARPCKILRTWRKDRAASCPRPVRADRARQPPGRSRTPPPGSTFARVPGAGSFESGRRIGPHRTVRFTHEETSGRSCLACGDRRAEQVRAARHPRVRGRHEMMLPRDSKDPAPHPWRTWSPPGHAQTRRCRPERPGYSGLATRARCDRGCLSPRAILRRTPPRDRRVRGASMSRAARRRSGDH